MMMNKEYLINLLNHLNRTAQSKVLSNVEIGEFEEIIEEIEVRKKQIHAYLNEINNLKDIEDFNWDFSKMNVSLDNSNLVIEQFAKIYLELAYCSERVRKLNTLVLKLSVYYMPSDSIREDQLN